MSEFTYPFVVKLCHYDDELNPAKISQMVENDLPGVLWCTVVHK